MSRQVLFPLSFTAMSDLFALMSLFVWTGMSHSHCVVFSYGRWPMLEIFVLHFDAIVLITSAEREVKDSRRSGMYQSWHFGDKIGHVKSVGSRFYSAIWRTESRISSRCLEITSISLIYSLTYSRKKEFVFWLSWGWPASKLSYLGKRREPLENAHSRETRFTRPNRRACSQAITGMISRFRFFPYLRKQK